MFIILLWMCFCIIKTHLSIVFLFLYISIYLTLISFHSFALQNDTRTLYHFHSPNLIPDHFEAFEIDGKRCVHAVFDLT